MQKSARNAFRLSHSRKLHLQTLAPSPSQALPRQLPRRGSQDLKPVAKVSGAMRKFPAVLLPLPLGEVDLRSKDGEGEDVAHIKRTRNAAGVSGSLIKLTSAGYRCRSSRCAWPCAPRPAWRQRSFRRRRCPPSGSPPPRAGAAPTPCGGCGWAPAQPA